jgi:hypothetical protein
MPFQSEKQRRYLWANEPEIARDWTDTYGSGIARALGGRIGLQKGMSPGEAQARGLGAQHHGSVTSGGLHAGNIGGEGGQGFVPGIGTVSAPPPKKEGILNVKNIKRAQTGLDAHALWNLLKTGSFKVNPLAWATNYGLSKLAKQKGKRGLQTNFADEDEMTIEELRDYFQGIGREELGIPKPGSVDWEDYMGGKVATGPDPYLPGLEPINTMNNPTWNPVTQEFEYNMRNTSRVDDDISNLTAGLGHYESGEQMHLPVEGLDPFGNYGIPGMDYDTYPPLRSTGAKGGRAGYNPGGLATLWQK